MWILAGLELGMNISCSSFCYLNTTLSLSYPNLFGLRVYENFLNELPNNHNGLLWVNIMQLNDETVLAIGMMSMVPGILIGRFVHF